MTDHRVHNFLVVWIIQPDAEVVDVDQTLGAILQQSLGSEGLKVVTSAASADLVQQVVRRLDIGIRVLVIEVIEDQPSPAPLKAGCVVRTTFTGAKVTLPRVAFIDGPEPESEAA